MKIGIPKETRSGETRVGATPDAVKRLIKAGFQVGIERGAGLSAGFHDAEYQSAGTELLSSQEAWGRDIVAKIHRLEKEDISKLKKGAVLISLLEPYVKDGLFGALAEQQITAVALELIPRTSRAQSMDVLSSQAGIAGYRAVIEAAAHYNRFFPLMMTSAGSAKAAKLTVLGAGVAGLQAIATGKKLGAAVEAYDVRPEVKEQIQSLGAKFIEIDIGEQGSGTGGYAKELSEEAKKKLQAGLDERLKKSDIIISTANIPGKKAPTLISEAVVKGMRRGSVVIDMAAANGGNCPLTQKDKITEVEGVKLVGWTNYPAMMASDSSNFFARNIVSLLGIMTVQKDGKAQFGINLEDDILEACIVTHEGKRRKDN